MSGVGWEPYLAFLRNLPVQGVLFGMLLFALGRLDFHRFDLSNWRLNVVAVMIGGAFVVAFFANLFTFIHNAFARHGRWSRRVQWLIRRQGRPEIEVPARLLVAVWYRKRLEAAEAIALLLLLQVGATVPFALGIFSVLGWAQVLHVPAR